MLAETLLFFFFCAFSSNPSIITECTSGTPVPDYTKPGWDELVRVLIWDEPTITNGGIPYPILMSGKMSGGPALGCEPMLGMVWLSGVRLLPWREEDFLMPVNDARKRTRERCRSRKRFPMKKKRDYRLNR